MEINESEIIWDEPSNEINSSQITWDDTIKKDINNKSQSPSDNKILTKEVMGEEFKSVYTQESQDLLEYTGRGAAKWMLGAVDSFYNLTGNEEASLEMEQTIDKNKDRILELGKKLGYTEDDWMNPSKATEIISEFMPLGWVRNLTAAVAGETVMGYMSGRGSGESQSEAVSSGIQQGLFTKLGGELGIYAEKVLSGNTSLYKNLIEGKSSPKEAFEFVKKQSGATDKEILKYKQDYSKAINKPVVEFTEADNINAIMNNSDVAGKFKVQAELYSDTVSGNLKKLDEQMTDMIKETTEGGGFNIPILQFQEYAKKSGELYGEVKDILIENFNLPVLVSDDIIDGIRSSVKGSSMTIDDTVVTRRILNTLENSDELDVAKLLEMKQDLNSLNLKSTKGFKAGEIGKAIDSEIEKAIGKEGFTVWKDVNKRYATKMLLESDNPIAKIFSEGVNKTAQLSSKQIAKKMLNLNKSGYGTFNSMREAIGEEAMSKVEKEIVNVALNEKGGLSKFLNKMNDFEFSTVEGRSILSELNRIKGAIPEDDVKKLLGNMVGRKTSSVGWSDNIVNKARFAVIGRVWDEITRRMPSASNERAMLTLGDVLRDTKKTTSMNIKSDKAFQQAFIDEQKELADSIVKLKEKGKNRTAKENKELASSIKMDKELNKLTQPQAGRSPKEDFYPDDLKDNPFIDEALENGSFSISKRKGEKIQTGKAGLAKHADGSETYIKSTSMPSEALQMELTPKMVNRIKAGKGTEEDFAALRHDASELDYMNDGDVF